MLESRLAERHRAESLYSLLIWQQHDIADTPDLIVSRLRCRSAHPTGDVGHPSEDSRGDEGAYEDEDGTSEFCAPLFD